MATSTSATRSPVEAMQDTYVTDGRLAEIDVHLVEDLEDVLDDVDESTKQLHDTLGALADPLADA